MFDRIKSGGQEIVKQAEEAQEALDENDPEQALAITGQIIQDCGTIARQAETLRDRLRGKVQTP